MTNNTTFPGILTCPTSSVSNAMTMGTTKTYVVTMTNASGANKYYIDGYLQASLVLHQGQTYIFDLSSSTLSGHPFEFSTTNNGSHGGGSAYSTGITTTGTYADDQTRKFVVSTSTPTTLYYYCTAHSGMGGSVTISPKAELIVSGGAEFIGTGTIKLPSGTTSERPTTGMTGMIRYNTTTGFIETYTAEGWGSIAPPPVITGISPTSVAGADTATQVFTVTGTGFDTGITIKLVGADGTEYSVFNTTRVSGQSATFKMGASGASGGYDVAQRPFNVKVIGGDTASAVTSTSTDSIALTVPTITGVSPTSFASSAVGSQTITVTGTNFASSMASGNNIQVLGADGSTLYNVDSAAVASATSITFKLAASGASLTTGQLDNRPYKVRVTDAVGITATSTATIGFNGIAWSSPASGATLSYDNGVSSSQNLVATDDLGGTDVTFSITSGSVAGLSLGSATASPATFSGSATTDGTTNVTFRVTDNESGTTADRTFSVAVVSALYSFTSHTFTNAGKTGRSGPSLSELRTAYSPSWTDNSSYLNVSTQGIQEWTVPETKSYTIKAAGAAGAAAHPAYLNTAAFRGIEMQRTLTLTKGDTVNILVGQMGVYVNSGGGGGGSFVYYSPQNTYPILAAGGGGGINDWGNTALGPSPTTYNPGSWTDGQSGTSGGGGNGGNNYGTNGAGGAGQHYGGGGAGWNSDGGDAPYGPGGGGHAPKNQGEGGNAGGGGGTAHGGFGGGGSTHGNTGGAGGGGGYSGGGGITDGHTSAGGGGSYGGSATGVYNAAGGSPVNGGHGYVIITKN
uniref:Uncharacterized protein n=1 Tax=viral metagenome TaxID=1070528 RepID=A0A6C0J1C1_9ZZZZ